MNKNIGITNFIDKIIRILFRIMPSLDCYFWVIRKLPKKVRIIAYNHFLDRLKELEKMGYIEWKKS